MTSYKIRAKSLVAGSLLGAGSLLAACGGSPGAAPTYAAGTYACAPAGAAITTPPAAPIPNQVLNVVVTLPASGTVGSPLTVGVDVPNMTLSAAPGFLDLNNASVVATIAVAGANAPATVAANNFLGNGASIDLNPASTVRTATAGANTVTVGTISILAGSSGFICTAIGAGATATLNV